MTRKAFLTALLPILTSFGCSKPAPQPPPIRPLTAQDLKNLSQPARDAQKDFAASQKLADELMKEKAAPKPSPAVTPNPAAAPGRTLASLEELSAVIQKAGYTPRSNDPSKVPYFMVTSDQGVTNLGFPEGLKILYILSNDKKTFTFVAVVRALRESEQPSQTEMMEKAPIAPALIAKLQSASPLAQYSNFRATYLPILANGSTAVEMPYLLFSISTGNETVNGETVKAVVSDIVMVLGATKEVWK